MLLADRANAKARSRSESHRDRAQKAEAGTGECKGEGGWAEPTGPHRQGFRSLRQRKVPHGFALALLSGP